MELNSEHRRVLAAQRGEVEAWDGLVREWLPAVLAWCIRLGGPRVDPDDATQEVMVIVVRRLLSLEDPACFPSWVFGITRRVLALHRRRAWVRRWRPGPWPEQIDPSPGPHELATLSEVGCQIQDLLERLPRKQREVLVLCGVEGRTAVEVAEMVGVSEGTVRSRLRLGRARFKREAEALDVIEDLAEVRWSNP